MDNLKEFDKFLIEEKNKKDIIEAKRTIFELQTILLYLNDNKYAVEVSTNNVTVGLCINKNLIPVIEAEIKEVEKFLNGQPNEWQ